MKQPVPGEVWVEVRYDRQVRIQSVGAWVSIRTVDSFGVAKRGSRSTQRPLSHFDGKQFRPLKPVGPLYRDADA